MPAVKISVARLVYGDSRSNETPTHAPPILSYSLMPSLPGENLHMLRPALCDSLACHVCQIVSLCSRFAGFGMPPCSHQVVKSLCSSEPSPYRFIQFANQLPVHAQRHIQKLCQLARHFPTFLTSKPSNTMPLISFSVLQWPSLWLPDRPALRYPTITFPPHIPSPNVAHPSLYLRVKNY